MILTLFVGIVIGAVGMYFWSKTFATVETKVEAEITTVETDVKDEAKKL